MAVFEKMQVTNAGKVQYAKAIAGKTLTFTNVKFGDGKPTGAVEKMTDLVNSKIEGAITTKDTTSTEGVCRLLVEIDNSTLEENIGIKEIGVFCKDPDTNAEVLYGYAYSVNDIDVIPSKSAGALTWKMWVALSVQNATGSVVVEETSQSVFTDLTPAPTVTPVSSDGLTHLSNVVASCRYSSVNGLVTAFYEVTGTLTNASGLSAVQVSLPTKTVAKSATVLCQMVVTESDASKTDVDVKAEVNATDKIIEVSYFGERNGTFRLLMTAMYCA